MRIAHGVGNRRHAVEFVLRSCQFILLLCVAVHAARTVAKALVELGTILF